MSHETLTLQCPLAMAFFVPMQRAGLLPTILKGSPYHYYFLSIVPFLLGSPKMLRNLKRERMTNLETSRKASAFIGHMKQMKL